MHIITEKKYSKIIIIWLLTLIFLLIFMIVVGGLTRLTDSCLSITEWDLISGILPPLTNDKWNYFFSLYKSIIDKNIEIIRILYFTQLTINKNVSLKKIIGCVSSIFNVIVDDVKKGSVLQFKRVSNYNEMDSQEAFIIEQLNLRKTIPEIISVMELNFSVSRVVAEEKIISFLNDVQVEVSAFEGKRLRIKSNPGFPVLIKKEKFMNIS